jgi:hypothetical protein
VSTSQGIGFLKEHNGITFIPLRRDQEDLTCQTLPFYAQKNHKPPGCDGIFTTRHRHHPPKKKLSGPGAAGAVRKNLIWASEGSDKDLIRIKITPQDMLIKQQSSNQTLAVHLRRTELFRANGWLISRGLALKTRKKTARSF